MPTFVMTLDCPHCGTTKAGMQGASPIFTAKGCRIPLVCPHCEEVVVTTADLDYGVFNQIMRQQPDATLNMLNENCACTYEGTFYPDPPTIEHLPHVPTKIGKSFVEAMENFKRGNLETCVLLCGKVIDVATKEIDPTWKLEKRLKKLATDGKLTPDMANWAEEIRLDRNTAIHEDHDFSAEQAQAILKFTEAFLTYVYTLPALVEAHRARKDLGSVGK